MFKEENELEEETIDEEESKNSNISDEIIDVDDEKEKEFYKGKEKYTGKEINVLKGLDAVRKRPGMYIGTTSSAGLHHLIWEIVDNSIDEALAGYCDNIKIILNKDNSVTVSDNGRGIPVDIVEDTGLSGVETVYTVLHAGSKFGEGAYKVSGGLHGVGASVVNALSKKVVVTVHKDGGIYEIEFENGGKTSKPLTRIGDCNDSGTTVTFWPDSFIFNETIVFNYETVKNRIRQMAFLNKGINMTLIDERSEPFTEENFKYEGGIKEYISFMNRNQQKVHDDIFYCEGAQIYKENDTEMRIVVEIAMQWTKSYNNQILSFCNNVTTGNGGMHEDGFTLALTRIFNAYAREFKILKDNDKDKFTAEDCKEGLTAIISIKHPNPQYEGQTKGKLGNKEVKDITNNVVGEQLRRYIYENKPEATAICAKIRSSYEGRLAARAAKENIRRKNGIEITTLPGKLIDCVSNDPSKCELFIVEGNSASGSAKEGREVDIQAVLPLRGKILNVQKAQTHKIFENAEIGNMISAIGAGYGEEFDISKARYHKIIIMTDADVDGSHIRVLLLTFFNRFMKPLIEHGYVYIAQPPLYKLVYKNKEYYAYNDEQLEVIKNALKITADHINSKKCTQQRFKGLGEMNPSQLEETTMNPNKRKLLKVTIDDAALADQIFYDLMGDDVEPRSEFIKKNARFVKNLDV